MSESPSSVAPVNLGDDRFLDHLASAADMVGARRFREAEVEVLRALSIAPSDLRVLKLLALVRFKLGRLEEARAVCREIAVTSPGDAGVRLKLGLIALKLDRVDESVQELEMASRLAPDDVRIWSYLGFAYARRGERALSAAAFRRAGRDTLAGQVEANGAVSERVNGPSDLGLAPPATGAVVVGLAQEPVFDSSKTDNALSAPRPGGAERPVSTLVDYISSRLAPPSEAAIWVGSTLRLAIGDGVFVRGDAVVACTGAARFEHAHRQVRGRSTAEHLSVHGRDLPFFRVNGPGDLFIAASSEYLIPVRLTDDSLYVREDRVLAFEGTVSWECGHVPRSGMRMLQFRGRGMVAIGAIGEPSAIKVTPACPVFVSGGHLLGWEGRVVARGTDTPSASNAGPGTLSAPPGPFHVTCEGDGVVLIDGIGLAPR